MARHNVSERWVRDIETEAEDLENFEANSHWRDAVIEVFDEVYDVGGLDAVEMLGNGTVEIVEENRHPKSARVRRMGRYAIQEQDVEIPATSSLLKSTNG